MNTTEFVSLLQATNTQGLFTANFGSGSAAEAAAWVQFTNVTHNWNIRRWEIGNEIYGSWETSWTHDGTAYMQGDATHDGANAFCAAMKAVDPTIEVGIVGALNYLASMNVNSIYFLVMNIGGDGKNVYPYLGPIEPRGSASNDNLHFDLAKLHQWGLVFDHAQRNSIMLHVVLNEAEEANKQELDGGALGVERKLYYRELVARFAHCPALQWNLCEEYNIKHPLLPELVKDFAQYLQDVDPYDHPITVHHAGNVDNAWAPFLGDPRFTVTSFQTRDITVVEQWREKSRAAGFPLVIGMDEFFPDTSRADNLDRHRREYLWPIYFSGGQLEFILDDLLDTNDFRKYEPLWRYMAYAREFIERYLPFWEMVPADEWLHGASTYQGEYNLVTGQVFAKPGQCYAVYLPSAEQTGTLDLSGAPGELRQRWYNPRTGNFAGTEKPLVGGGPVPLGPPPETPNEDWVVLIAESVPSNTAH